MIISYVINSLINLFLKNKYVIRHFFLLMRSKIFDPIQVGTKKYVYIIWVHIGSNWMDNSVVRILLLSKMCTKKVLSIELIIEFRKFM